MDEPPEDNRLERYGLIFGSAGLAVALAGIGIAGVIVVIVWAYAHVMNGF